MLVEKAHDFLLTGPRISWGIRDWECEIRPLGGAKKEIHQNWANEGTMKTEEEFCQPWR